MDRPIPNIKCRNCGSALPEGARFCPQCAQKNTDGRLSFGELMANFFDTAFNIDNRIFQTLAALLVPGKLTGDYFSGKQIRYYHPMRLFIVSASLFLVFVTILLNDIGIKEADFMVKKAEAFRYKKEFFHQLDTVMNEVRTRYPGKQTAMAFDSLAVRMGGKEGLELEDSITMASWSFGGAPGSIITKIPTEDFARLSEKELVEKYYEGDDFLGRHLFMQSLRVMKSTRGFIFYMISNVIWMVLIMMPMSALALKLLYIRRSYLYYEHLLFSFHVHTFIFLLLAFQLFLEWWIDWSGAGWFNLIIPVYVLLAMKHFYGQGWGKTILKFFIATFFYLFILLLALFLLTLSSVFLF
ncbi:MAG TPA: DUF3667 domain-containing protein [Bacteroidetes bacterium]|nr:DUF3667 domain-containing protein [Bacteroidota bacterium]